MKSIVYCTSNQQVVCGYENGQFSIWSTDSGALLSVIRGHSSAIISLKWLDGPSILITASLDGNLKFWKFPAKKSEKIENLKIKSKDDDIIQEDGEVGRI